MDVYWISIGLLWFFYRMSYRMPKEFYGISLVLQRDFNGIPMGFLWDVCDISYDVYRNSIGFLWYFKGISMEFLWDFCGMSVVYIEGMSMIFLLIFLRDFYGISMIFLWYFHGIPV